jgi:hypothetical protein
MRFFVYVPFVACALGIAGAPRLARRTNPRTAARVLLVTGLMLAVASAAALALLAFATAARIPLVARHGHWTAGAVGSHAHVPMWLGVLATACIVAIVANAARTAIGYARRFPHAVRLQLERGGEIVAVTDGAAYAYACRALPFLPGVIVVSDGLNHTLDAEERAAVLAHERSHLEHQHNLYELGALLTRSLNPLLQPIERQMRFCLERWADEDAAAAQGRSVAASALAASALHAHHPVAAVRLAHASDGVPARIEALLDGPTRRGRLWIGSATANALLAAVAAVLAAHSTELIFEALRR